MSQRIKKHSTLTKSPYQPVLLVFKCQKVNHNLVCVECLLQQIEALAQTLPKLPIQGSPVLCLARERNFEKQVWHSDRVVCLMPHSRRKVSRSRSLDPI